MNQKTNPVSELSLPSNFLDRLDTIITKNLHKENFSIEILCKELTVSYTHTYRKIRTATGLSPSMYICKMRLKQACQLLEITDLNIRKIAFRVGFNTQAYFSKCFTDWCGCPPLRYRRSWTNGEVKNLVARM